MMSFDYNFKFWVGTKRDIEQLIKRQNVLKKLQPVSNPLITYKIFSELFILYVELVNKLSYVYHHTFQVQKRKIVRNLVESAARRLLELKNQLKELELSEYVYTDKALIAKKLSPHDLIIWRSPNFLYRRPPDIQNIIYENKIYIDDEFEKKEAAKEQKKLSDNIVLIQAHERARQARVYESAIKYNKSNLKIEPSKKVSYAFNYGQDQPMSLPVKRTIFSANFIKADEICLDMITNQETESISKLEDIDDKKNVYEKAAQIIQKAWKLYKYSKVHKKQTMFQRVLYGMKTKRKTSRPNHYSNSVVEMYKNELLKKKLDEDYVRLLTNERNRILQQRAPWIMEDISDHIRAWFKAFYENVGDFHPYPEEIKSGTVLVLIDETMNFDEFQEKLKEQSLSKEEKKKRAEKLKLQRKKEKEKLKKEKLKEAKRKKKMKAAGIYDIGEELQTNKDIQNIEKTIQQYSIDWRNVDEYLNKNFEAIKDWVTEDELAVIHKELRALVDEYMRIEYELLRQALAIDLKKKYKPTKQKKPKKKKAKKKKKVVDMTADRTLQSLFDELKKAGVIEKYENKSFDDFIAEFNFVADETRDEYNLTTVEPAKGDIKTVIQECMLGMGEFDINKPKSLFLIGPLKNGKKLLCNIIASELDAVFFNISPEKTLQFSENIDYFIHVLMKVAKAFQPSVLFINDVHRVFWKKVPKEQEFLNPRILQNILAKKVLKQIKKEDRVILLGTSDTPWAGKGKLKKIFQKILLVPRSDYGTSFLLWLEFLEKSAGENNLEDYAISALAKVLQGYTSGDVNNNVNETLDIHRRMRLKADPLSPAEFVEHFIQESYSRFPLEEKLLQKYIKWFNKSNKLSKQRMKFFKEINMKKQKKK